MATDARNYPLSELAAASGLLFTTDLVLDVFGVLVRHGFPAPALSGMDAALLHRALHSFIYGPTNIPGHLTGEEC
ncbi:MAG: hypothetical protein JWQ81_6517 [Amycolatopsis sp.]|uniref:hypothetical protein n=1 Tax=Amycolatopsis sp. TaxID=37632 RepID=UPI002628ACB4|nr:hypothetical protein [Amycolatopsis sp.]MCU1685778.1 hypothetical protein [Amycolatopsis sp.]